MLFSLGVTIATIFLTQCQAHDYKCPDGWNLYQDGQTCIKTVEGSAKNWNDARTVCQNEGGDLVKISDPGIRDFVKGELSPRQKYWIGLHDNDNDGKFTWLDEQQQTTFEWWHCRNPDNYKLQERCVEAIGSKNGRWNDKKCSKKRSYICQKQAEERSLSEAERLVSCDFENDELPTCGYSTHLIDIQQAADSVVGPKVDASGSGSGHYYASVNQNQFSLYPMDAFPSVLESCLKFWLYVSLTNDSEIDLRIKIDGDSGLNLPIEDDKEQQNRWIPFYVTAVPNMTSFILYAPIKERIIPFLAVDNIVLREGQCQVAEMEKDARVIQ